MHIENKKRLAATAKWALPFMSGMLMTRFTGAAVRYAELGCSLVQGKGAGTGWDIDSEARAAARFIRTRSPFLMDVGANFGEWSRTMIKLFPHCSKIVMIEPQAQCVLALGEVEFANKLIIPCAISDQPGSATYSLHVPGGTRPPYLSVAKRISRKFGYPRQQSLP